MCSNMTPEVTARPSVKMKVLQESSEPQLLLALSEAWCRPSGRHLRGQGAWISLLQGSLHEAWLGHPAAVWNGEQIAVVLVCGWSLSALCCPWQAASTTAPWESLLPPEVAVLLANNS